MLAMSHAYNNSKTFSYNVDDSSNEKKINFTMMIVLVTVPGFVL